MFALNCAWLGWLSFVWCTSFVMPALADVVVYGSLGSPTFVLPEGRAQMLPGRWIVFQIPNVGSIQLHAATATIVKGPTRDQRFDRLLRNAKQRQDVQEALAAAEFALDHGMLDECYEAASLAWHVQPKHPTVRRLVAIQRE